MATPSKTAMFMVEDETHCESGGRFTHNWLRIEAMQIMADALMNGWLMRRDHARGDALLRRAAKLDPHDYYAAR